MATPQLSPGVLVREVDLTVGRAENVLDNIGAIAGPFSLGPVNEPITIETQQQFLDTFGKPIGTDRQYEYWMSGNSFLSYGGILKVVRVGGDTLNNGNAGTQSASETVRIDNLDDYEQNHQTDSTFYWAARNPGTWSNSLKVCTIDNLSDQIISVATTNPGASGFVVGYGVSAPKDGTTIPGNGSLIQFNGSLKGIITGVNTDAQIAANSSIEVKVLSRVTPVTQSTTNIGFTTVKTIGVASTETISVNSTVGVTTGTLAVIQNNPGSGGGEGAISIVSFGSSTITLAVGIAQSALVGTAVTYQTLTSIAGSETPITYQNYNSANSFSDSDVLITTPVSGIAATTFTSATVADWYDQQTLGLTNSTVYWRNVAPRPVSNRFVTERSGANDAIHIVVVDDSGDVTGVQGNIVERFVSLSKASDATADGDNPTRTYYKDFVANNSKFAFAGFNPSNVQDTYWNTIPTASGFSTATTPYTNAQGLWGQEAQGISFSSLGNVSYTLTGGVDYSANKGMAADLSGLLQGYNLFANKDEIAVDYLIMGPGLR